MDDTQVLSERARIWIVEPTSVTVRPISIFGERLSGGAADENVGLSWGKLGGLEQLLRRNGPNVVLDHWPASIKFQGLATNMIYLNSDARLEACRLESEIEPPGPCEQADGLEHIKCAV